MSGGRPFSMRAGGPPVRRPSRSVLPPHCPLLKRGAGPAHGSRQPARGLDQTVGIRILAVDQRASARARRTFFGSFRIARSSALAGPVGSRRPCSQFLIVLTSTPSSAAKSGWLSRVWVRSDFTSVEATLNTRDARRRPAAMSPACCTLSSNLSNSTFFISELLQLQRVV